MAGFTRLLKTNRNYRYTWTGQIVSEIGDHFNTVAVFSLALQNTGSGPIIAGLLLKAGVRPSTNRLCQNGKDTFTEMKK